MSITIFKNENINLNKDTYPALYGEAVKIKIRILTRLSGFSFISNNFFDRTTYSGDRRVNITEIIKQLHDITDSYWWIVNKDLDCVIESVLVQNNGPYRLLAVELG